MSTDRRGAFWDMIEGRRPAPPAARLLGWRLGRIDPEQGMIRVEFEGKEVFLTATATARVVPFAQRRSSP